MRYVMLIKILFYFILFVVDIYSLANSGLIETETVATCTLLTTWQLKPVILYILTKKVGRKVPRFIK